MSEARWIVVSSISRFCHEFTPAAMTQVPGSSRLPSNTGSHALVIVTTMSEPCTHSSGVPTPTISRPVRSRIVSANFVRFSSSRE